MAERTAEETFEAFKNSFFYGSRTDLSFKFLQSLPAGEAAEFLAAVLKEIGAGFDDGDLSRLHQLVYEWQVRAYAGQPGAARYRVYDDGPFTLPTKPVADSRVGLLTSSGHFVAGDDPQPLGVADMTQEEAIIRMGEFLRTPPELSVIPATTPRRDLRVRHGGYDIRSAERDPNVTFPLEVLADAAADGAIGAVADEAYSFVGATAQTRLRRVIPDWIARIVAARIDVLLLVPV